jgi:hypothetical protein
MGGAGLLLCALCLLAVPAVAAGRQSAAGSGVTAETAPGTSERSTQQQLSPYLSGFISLGSSDVDLGGSVPAGIAAAVDLAGKVSRRTKVNLSFLRGTRHDLSALFQDAPVETRLRLDISHPAWSVALGRVTSASGALSGVSTSGEGMAFKWKRGLFAADTIVARPASIGYAGGGHLLRAMLGIRTSVGLFGVTFSEVSRPTRRSANENSTLAEVYAAREALQEAGAVHGPGVVQELQRADFQQIARSFSMANRVRGTGFEADTTFAGHHRIVARMGMMGLTNESGQQGSGASGELRYSLTTTRTVFNSRFRRIPASLPGVSLPGDELAVDGTVSLGGGVSLSGRAYDRSTWIVGRPQPSEGTGTSAGIEYAAGETRLGIRVNYRESTLLRTRTTESVGADFGRSLGRLLIDGTVELGDTDDGRAVHRMEVYRGMVTWKGTRGSLSGGVASADYGVGQRQIDLDVTGAMQLGRFDWHGGADATRGGLLGVESRLWTGMAIPVHRDLRVLIGAEYTHWDARGSVWEDPSERAGPWRVTFAVQRKVGLPLQLRRGGYLQRGGAMP